MKMLFTTAALLASASALAQTAAGGPTTAAAANEGLEEIVVTAQKREERILDVPITVSALSGDRLRALGLSEFDEISAFTPGLLVQEQSANNPGFVIRGITSDTGSAQQAARVTVYYNGVDISRSRGVYQDLYDLERVEVVKGPQATLFGTAAAIGAVSVISARPRLNATEALLTVGFGNIGQRRVEAMVNVGGEKLGLRVAGAWKAYDGYVPNIAGRFGTLSFAQGLQRQEDLNGKDNLGFRVSGRAQPNERTTIDLIFTYDRQSNTGTAFKSGSLPPSFGAIAPWETAELGGARNAAGVLGDPALGLKRTVRDANLTVQTELSSALQLTFITAYRDFKSNEVFDADGSGLQYLEFAEDAEGSQFSHETRLTYTGDRFRGFAGASIFHEDSFQRVPFQTEEGVFIACTRNPALGALQAAIGNPACVLPGGVSPALNATRLFTRGAVNELIYNSVFTNFGTNTTYSVFADGTVTLGPVELTAGARYVWEERKSAYVSVIPNLRLPTLIGLPASFTPFGNTTFGQRLSAEASNSAFLPRFNALFRVADGLNVYATVAKGRRSPAVDLSALAPAAGVPRPNRVDIPAEEVWNYEGGVKFARAGISGSVGAFYQDYSNFIVSVFNPDRGVFENRPAGNASNFGVEAEAQARVGDLLNLFGSVGYIDAKIDNDPSNGRLAGQRFRLQPKWQYALGGTLTVPAGGLEVFLTPTYTYRSRIFFEQPNSRLISERGIGLTSVRGGVRSADGRWQLTGYATNLFDVKYIIDAGNTGGGFGYPTFIAGAPRFYGVEASIRF